MHQVGPWDVKITCFFSTAPQLWLSICAPHYAKLLDRETRACNEPHGEVEKPSF